MNVYNKLNLLVEDGDIIFIRNANYLYKRVAETCASWESHVGILFREENNFLVVAESTIPKSKFTPLEQFIERSENKRFLIKRIREPLTEDEKKKLLNASRDRMNIYYHLGFNYDNKKLYCSKFVYDVYKCATGKELGRIQDFRNLIKENPDAPVYFWRLWFFGFIPWNRRCITTTSILKDKSLETIYDSNIN